MNEYVITSLSGSHTVTAENVAAALRSFQKDNPGQSVLSVVSASVQRAAEQQA